MALHVAHARGRRLPPGDAGTARRRGRRKARRALCALEPAPSRRHGRSGLYGLRRRSPPGSDHHDLLLSEGRLLLPEDVCNSFLGIVKF